MATPYCTPQDVIELCSWPAFGRLTQQAQGTLIAVACEWIDDQCGRSFGEAMVTQSFDGAGQGELWLTTTPVRSIASVTIDGDALDDTNDDAWSFDADSGRLIRGTGIGDPRFGRRWPHGDDNIVVRYWGGYSADDMPARLKLAAAVLVRHLRELGRITGVYQSESIGDYSSSLAAPSGPLPPHVASILGTFLRTEVFF